MIAHIFKHSNFIGISLALVALSTGCATSPEDPGSLGVEVTTQNPLTVGELCGSLAKFFTDEFNAVDIRAVPTVPPENTVTISGICVIAQDANPVGRWESRKTSADTDPTEGVSGFDKTINLEETVRVRDLREDRANPSTEVKLAVRVGDWNARLGIRDREIRTSHGILKLTDSEIAHTANMLIRLATSLANGSKPK